MTLTKQDQSSPEDLCAGYLREPHTATIALYRQYPNGTQDGLCKTCATRWLLSDDNWPPSTRKNSAKPPT